MAIRSHVDPCLFVVYMNVKRDHIGHDLEETLKTFQLRQGESVAPVLSRFHPRSQQIYFHELYHFWQGIRLPFLFRYAFISFLNTFEVFREMSRVSTNYRTWSGAVMEFNRLGHKTRIGFAPGGKLYLTAIAQSLPRTATEELLVSPLDLLECAATIAEFQVMSPAEHRADPKAFRRWAKRNPAYLEPFDFVSRFLGNETLALRAILPLINAAFHTSIPEKAFVELLARLWGNFANATDLSRQFLAQPEPCRWTELYQKWLPTLDYDSPPDSDMTILPDKYHRLNWSHWVKLEFRSGKDHMIHPVLGPVARKWSEDERQRPVMSWLMDMPGWVGQETASHCRKEYNPPLTFARFHLGEGKDQVMWFGSGDFSGITSVAEWNSKAFIAEFFTMYSAVRRATGGHFDNEQRVCYHTACPHYEANFCNAYPMVPEKFETCGFPERMERLTTPWSRTDANAKT